MSIGVGPRPMRIFSLTAIYRAEGAPVTLQKGVYKMVTDFYQSYIGAFALLVEWKKPGSAAFVPIPGEAMIMDVAP